MWRSSRELAFHHAFIRIASSSSRCYGFHQALRPLGLCPVPHLSSRHSELSVALNEPRSRKLFHTQSSSLDRDGQPTIYALSTASGRAAIAVIRISGSACRQIYSSLCPSRPLPKPRYATLRTLYDPSQPPSSETILDSDALVLYFPSPKTVTGEDILELHIHGGEATIRAVLAAIPRCIPSVATPISHLPIRYAEPGEFTRRAFLHDRLSLPQIEALGDTLSATTEQQRRLSVRGASAENRLAQTYETWRQQLLHARGELEALIDFAEDQQFEASPLQLVAGVTAQVEALKERLQLHSRNAMRGELLRKGISLALLGAPNAGKSSLLNCIVGREAAIVSREAGTTRDVVEVGVDLGGWFVRLGDMAGLRKRSGSGQTKIEHGEAAASQASDVIKIKGENAVSDVIGDVEQEGIRRAKQRALESDVVLVVLSLEESEADASGHHPSLRLETEVIDTARHCRNVLVAINKIDLQLHKASSPTRWVDAVQQIFPEVQASRIFLISCQAASTTSPEMVNRDPGGIQTLLQGLIEQFKDLTTALVPKNEGVASHTSHWQESLGATERQRRLLDECAMHLDRFLDGVRIDDNDLEENRETVADELEIVVAAEHLRTAAECLAKITGKGESGDVEEVLGVVFEKFCVGK